MKIDDLSREDKFVLRFFYVLDKIKREHLMLIDENESLVYTVFIHPVIKDQTIPSPTEEQLMIIKLEKLNAIKQAREESGLQIGEDELGNSKSGGMQFYLKLNHKIFDRYYSKYKKKVSDLKKHTKIKNILIINQKDGKTIFISPSKKVYKTQFSPKSNSYKLLMFLIRNPRQHFDFDELAKQLKSPKVNDDSSSNERRVRDAIQYIKEKLGYKGCDLFETDYGFTLKTNTQINN